MSQHSPEPWKQLWELDSDDPQRWPSVWTADNRMIVAYHDDTERSLANAKRIVACVNFCRDFDTEWLEKRQMVQANGFESLADIPDFDGLVPIAPAGYKTVQTVAVAKKNK